MLKLSKPYIPTTSLDRMKQVIISGNLVQGQNVLEFENNLSEYLNTKHVVLVANGTAALHIALMALNIGEGDEVIIPAYSFPAVANVVELVGASCVFVDITLDDYCIDADKIEEKISTRTKAIMPVHEFGQAADMIRICDIAKDHGLSIIEDAACAIGTTLNRRKAGSFGDLGCFSFHPRKILTTGEGGAVITDNEELADKLRKLRNHGIQFGNGKSNFELPGFNYRITDFQAAMGIYQLMELDETINIHRGQAAHYHNAFKNISSIRVDTHYEDRRQTYQTYHILFEDYIPRDYIKSELLKKGIESNLGAYSIPDQIYYKEKYNWPYSEYRNANIAYRQGLALPLGRHLEEGDLQFISDSVISLLNHGF